MDEPVLTQLPGILTSLVEVLKTSLPALSSLEDSLNVCLQIITNIMSRVSPSYFPLLAEKMPLKGNTVVQMPTSTRTGRSK